MAWFARSERDRWAVSARLAKTAAHVGLPALDPHSHLLYGSALPRGVQMARSNPDRPPQNFWMAPQDLLRYAYQPGQIVLGKLAGQLLGYLDDRPLITIAGARAGKTSTILVPNLYLYPGSMLVLDPKHELAETAALRKALGHNVYKLDPFGASSACYNGLEELDPESPAIIDDAATVTQAFIVDDGDARARHWNDSARTLLLGIILLVLTLDRRERNLVTVRELLSLTYAPLLTAMRDRRRGKDEGPLGEDFYEENKQGVATLLKAMVKVGNRFGGIAAAIGSRFLATPPTERGSIFSTAAAQTDFLDSLPLRKISRWSDFKLASLRGDKPTTIFLCLPVGRMESHFRWMRLVVQMACTVLERFGTYPRERPPILFMMEEFATLGHMEIMERAAAYFPGFGIKLWAVLQDITQLQRYYQASWETFLGNAGLIQCFSNGDQATLDYITRRLEKLIVPSELRMAFSRQRFSQLLMMEGELPAAATRLEHEDVARLRARIELNAKMKKPMGLSGPV